MAKSINRRAVLVVLVVLGVLFTFNIIDFYSTGFAIQENPENPFSTTEESVLESLESDENEGVGAGGEKKEEKSVVETATGEKAFNTGIRDAGGECKTGWKCGDWDECNNGISRRVCGIRDACEIVGRVPSTVRRCEGEKEENVLEARECIPLLDCKYPRCKLGQEEVSATCRITNGCFYQIEKEIPKSLKCLGSNGQCVPNVVCSGWSSCKLGDSLIGLIEEEVIGILGTQERVCVDRNGCSSDTIQERDCSFEEDKDVGFYFYSDNTHKIQIRDGQNIIGTFDKKTREINLF